MKFLFLILLLSVPVQAKIDEKLLEHIQLRCNWFNSKIPLDVREDCMTDYLNCAVVGAGKTDLSKADDACLTRKAKEREDDRL